MSSILTCGTRNITKSMRSKYPIRTRPKQVGKKVQNESEIARPIRAKPVQRWKFLNGLTGVYVVGTGNLAKIGWSANVGNRLRQLEGGTPYRLHLYGLGRTHADAAKGIEIGLHRRFKELRVKGEWFRLEGQLKDFLSESADLQIDGSSASEREYHRLLRRIAKRLIVENPDYPFDEFWPDGAPPPTG